MRIERTKNASRNVISGILLKSVQTFLPFLMRTAIIYCLGVQYLGLNSLFSSVLQVLNLAELGVGNAMVFSMYKPIAEDDTEKICALMQLYKLYYRIIGGTVLVAGLIILPFIPNLISGEVPSDVNIFIIYLMNLISTVFSYWLFAYEISLLHAHQRGDIVSKVSMICSTIQYGLQLCVLYFLRNYYLYLFLAIVMQVINNIVTYNIVRCMYPQYSAHGKLSSDEVKKINGRVKDLFVSKIGSVVVNSADTIVISAFLGLSVLAIYQNYYYILTSIIGFVGIIFNACTAGIGNSLITESLEKNYNDLKKITMIIMWITGFCTICLLCLYQPFMEIWVGKNLMLNFSAVICFCIYYYIYEINQVLLLYKDADYSDSIAAGIRV